MWYQNMKTGKITNRKGKNNENLSFTNQEQTNKRKVSKNLESYTTKNNRK